jgi:hypothetical protein
MRMTAVTATLRILCLSLLPCGAMGQSTDVATLTVHVTSAPSAGEKVPAVQMLQGQPSVQIGREETGQTVAISQGTYVFLRFPGALGFEAQPPGILVSQPGVYHLPRGIVGMLRAERPGTATITLKGIPGRRLNGGNGNPSGGTSPNWSGYAITGGPFASISGQWRVPAVTGDAGSASTTWIGIDGDQFGNNTLIQTGTEQDWSSGAGPSYSAWWEVLPAAETAFPTSGPVLPGDLMVASIWLTGTTGPMPGEPQTWAIVLTDSTQNWTAGVQVTYSGMLDSAEWIEEATADCSPSSCSISALADYGVTQFDGQDFVNTGSPNLNASESINMVQGGATVSSPSNPDGDLDGFSVAFGGTSPPPPGPFVLTTTLPNGFVNYPYAATLQGTEFTGSGTVTNFNWSARSNLPSWLTLNESSGFLTGTPGAAGTSTFSVVAVDTTNPFEVSQVQPLTLTILPGPPPPNFSLTASPQYFRGICTATPEIAATTEIIVNPTNGFNQNVALSASGMPADTTASFDPVNTATKSKLVVTTTGCQLGRGTNFITVTGDSGSLSHQTALVFYQPVTGCPSACASVTDCVCASAKPLSPPAK